MDSKIVPHQNGHRDMAGRAPRTAYDVIVVGAGPAGSAVAALLARAEFAVLLLGQGRVSAG